MKHTASTLFAALILAACSPQAEHGTPEISASEREAEEAATAYQAASETFTAPAENDDGLPDGSAPSEESPAQ